MESQSLIQLTKILTNFASEIKESKENTDEIVQKYAETIQENDFDIQSKLIKQLGFFYWEYDYVTKKVIVPYKKLKSEGMPPRTR